MQSDEPSTCPGPNLQAPSRLDSVWAGVLILLGLTAIFYLPGISALPLMDRDEPKFAQAAWEMLERDEWVVPYLNGEYRFDKPVLSYWMMQAHYLVFGKDELSARLHSVETAWFTAVVILLLGRFLFSPRAGLWAGVAWLTCFQILIHGRLSVADMPMLFFVTLSMLAVAKLLFAEEVPKRFGPWVWTLGVAQGLGFLAKGPIAFFVPLLSLLIYVFYFRRGQASHWQRIQPLTVALVALAVIAPWGIAALLKTNGAFWGVGMGEHVVRRGLDAFNGRVVVPVVYYLFTQLPSLLPWSPFLPLAFRDWRDRTSPEAARRAFLISWFVAPHLIFIFYRTQLPHYIMPGFPAFFLLLFASGGLPKIKSRLEKVWFWCVVGLFLALGGIVAAAGQLAPVYGKMEEIKPVITSLGLALFLLGAVAVLLRLPTKVHIVAAGLVFVFAGNLTFLRMREISPAVQMEELWDEMPDRTKWRMCQFEEPSLLFYTDTAKGWDPVEARRWERVSSIEKTLAWLEKKGPRAAVFLLKEWKADDGLRAWIGGDGYYQAEKDFSAELGALVDLQARVNAVAGERVFEVTEGIEGYNSARSSWVQLVVVRRWK